MITGVARPGLTLVELLVVLTVLGVVATAATLAPTGAVPGGAADASAVRNRLRRQAVETARAWSDTTRAKGVRTVWRALPDGRVLRDTALLPVAREGAR